MFAMGRSCYALCVFHKHSLVGDTRSPSGLYAWLCHAFLVLYLKCKVFPYSLRSVGPESDPGIGACQLASRS